MATTPPTTSSSRRSWLGTAVGVVLAVAVRPRLWPSAVRAMRRTSDRGWWRRPPFLPLPRGDYLAFRLITQYGDTGARPSPHDVVNYLTWLRDWDRAAT